MLRTSSVNRRASRKGKMSTNPVSRRSSVQLSMGRPLSTTVQAPPHTHDIIPGCIRNEAEELSRRQTLDKSGSTSCRFFTYTPICSRHAYPAPHMSMKRKSRWGTVRKSFFLKRPRPESSQLTTGSAYSLRLAV